MVGISCMGRMAFPGRIGLCGGDTVRMTARGGAVCVILMMKGRCLPL
jgi:hypothetical protein